MQLTRSFKTAAIVAAGLVGASWRAEAVSNPTSAGLRVNCGTQACAALSGSFAGRVDWYSGNVSLFSETGTFIASPDHDILITLTGNGNAGVFQSTYLDAATTIFAAPDLNYYLYSTTNGDTLLVQQAYQPEGSALWAKHSEDAQSEAARATSAEAAEVARARQSEANLNTAISIETSTRINADSAMTTSINNEKIRAQGAEATFGNSLSVELQRATNAESAISSSISGETTARKAADATELARAQTAETALTSSLNAEITRALAAESVLSMSMSSIDAAITAEIAARQSTVNTVQTNIANEATRATAGEAAMLASAKSYADGKSLPTCTSGQTMMLSSNVWVCRTVCSGKLVDVKTDSANCGSCAAACSSNNATESCTNGACVVSACNANFADCNTNAGDGCEVNKQTDNNNCGACGTVCNGGKVCQAGACVNPSVHGTVAWAGFTSYAGACNYVANGVNTGNYQWLNVGSMTWKACMLEASKRGAQAKAPSGASWPTPAWWPHRQPSGTSPNLAMTGGWSTYTTADISTNQTCILLMDPQSVALNQRNTITLSNTVTYDGNNWHYQDFGVKWSDECELLAGQAGGSIITPATVGLGSGANYWDGVLHTCSVNSWIVAPGNAFSYDNTSSRTSQHSCMIGFMDQ